MNIIMFRLTWPELGLLNFFKKYLFIYLAASGLSCGIFSCGMRTLSCSMWDLVPWPGIEGGPPALGAWRFNHWTTREVPVLLNFCLFSTVSGIQYPKRFGCWAVGPKNIGKNVVSTFERPGFKSWLFHLLIAWNWLFLTFWTCEEICQ